MPREERARDARLAYRVAADEELLDLVSDLGGQAVAGMLGVGWLLDDGRETNTGCPVRAISHGSRQLT